MDVTLVPPAEIGDCFDIALSCGDLLAGHDLSTAITISLLTDRRAGPDDALPDGTDRRGWWGDALDDRLWGSRLWLLDAARDVPETHALAAGYAKESLDWLVQDGIAQSVGVTADRLECGRATMLRIEVKKMDGKLLSWRYRYLWDQLRRDAIQ